jgi:Icc-related predicted phosphoesterase
MNILLVADLHELSKKRIQQQIDSCYNINAVISLGDTPADTLKLIKNRFPSVPTIGVLGNHDYMETLEHAQVQDANQRLKYIGSVKVTGLHGSLDYKQATFPSYSQFESLDAIENMVKSDIFICHASPYSIHDDRLSASHGGLMGSLQYIKRFQPKYCLHGHMHERAETVYNNTHIIGVYGIEILNYETGEIVII